MSQTNAEQASAENANGFLKRKELSFCLIILLAICLRFAGICFDSLWLDESYQSMVGAFGHGPPALDGFHGPLNLGPPAELKEMLAKFRSVDPLCPPLYAVLLNRWISMFGEGDFAIRSLSAIISSLSVAALLLFARSLLGTRAALIAGLLNAVSPFDIHYAQEARMYSLVTFCSVVSGGSLLLILRSQLQQAKDYLFLPLYAVSTAAMVNSHYTALFLAAAQGFCSSFYLIFKRDFRLFLFLVLAWAGTAVACLPWLQMFLQSASSRKESFYVARVPDLIWPLKAFLRIPINWLVFLSGQRVIAYAAGLYLSSGFMLASAAFFCFPEKLQKRIPFLASITAAAKKSGSAGFQPASDLPTGSGETGSESAAGTATGSGELFSLRALWLWAIIPALGIWLIDLLENHKVVEVARYLIFTSPAIYMLAGCGLAKLQPKKRLFMTVLLLHLLFAAMNLVYTHTVKQREPWREMAAEVEKYVPADQPLIVSQFYDIACLDRYLRSARLQIGASPAMGVEKFQSILEGKSSFALLTAQDGEPIKDYVPAYFKLVKQVDLSHGLHLRLYEREK